MSSFVSFVHITPFLMSLLKEKSCLLEINRPSILFHPLYPEEINPTLKLWIKQDTSSNTLLFLHVMSFLDVPPLSFSLHLPQLSWRDREEIHVPGRVFVSNGSASAAAVAGISITSVVPFLPCMDQLPVSG